MKKLLIGILVSAAAVSASAATWFNYGVLYGTVCRNGIYFTVYPPSMAQPVGTTCPIRDSYGNVMGYGIVTNE